MRCMHVLPVPYSLMTNAAACLSASTMSTEPQHHELATLTKTTHANTEAESEEDEQDWQENNNSHKRGTG